VSVMRGRTVYRETGRKETRGGRKEKRGEGRNEKSGGRMDKRTPCPPPLLWYSVFAANS